MLTTAEFEALPAIEAPMSFVIDTGERLVTYASQPGVGAPTEYKGRKETRTVTIHDGRPVVGKLSLDEEGFVLVDQRTAVTDFYDDAQVKTVYEAEIEALVKALTGAERAFVFDHTRRADSEAVRGSKQVRDPARMVHNDYTEKSARQRVRDLLPDEADELLARRFAIINIWRSAAGPVETAPMAMCDARTLAREELIVSERRAEDRIGELQQVVFSPNQRWFWFPQMRPDEALVFKTYDSATDGRAQLSVHSAFVDPTAPADATPRESIETRVFAFF